MSEENKERIITDEAESKASKMDKGTTTGKDAAVPGSIEEKC